MSVRLFVTGTGTEIGKTYLTEALLCACPEARAIKPVVSGYAEAMDSDPARLLAAMRAQVTPEAVAAVSPWRFAAPLSPHLAAVRENKRVILKEIVAFCRSREGDTPIIAEGAGGVMSPLTDAHTNLDLIEALGYDAVLVCGAALGGISQALTALEALKSRGVPMRAAVVNAFTGNLAAETAEAIARFASLPVPVYILSHNASEEHSSWLPTLIHPLSSGG